MTALSSSELPLGVALYNSMAKSYPLLSMVQQESIRALFTVKSLPTSAAHPAVQQWLMNEKTLFNRVTTEPGHMMQTVFAPFVLNCMNKPPLLQRKPIGFQPPICVR